MNLVEQFIVAACGQLLARPAEHIKSYLAAMQVLADATTLPPKPECHQRDSGKFVILRGTMEENFWDTFFTTSTPGTDETKLANGARAYRVLGYADTIAEAQRFIFGYTFSRHKVAVDETTIQIRNG